MAAEHWTPHPAVRSDASDLTRGERAAEWVAARLGSWTFIICQTVLIVAWITTNIFAVALRWDPYPFILLNLAFSTQAAYAAPILQLAQNRTDRVRAELAMHDYEASSQSLAILQQIRNDLPRNPES